MQRLVKIRSCEIFNKKLVYFRIRWDPLTPYKHIIYENIPSPLQPPPKKRTKKGNENSNKQTKPINTK